jgi:uncharacterized membrane protein
MTDERLERMIGNTLRAGVLTSAAIVGIAGLFYLIQHRTDHVTYEAFQLERANLRMLPGIFRSAVRLRTDALIQMGLVFLIATPIARVVLAAVGFHLERDWLYVGISLVVGTVLVYSLMHAL